MLLYTVPRIIAIGKEEGQWNEKGRLMLDDIKETSQCVMSICLLTLSHTRASTLVSTKRLNLY